MLVCHELELHGHTVTYRTAGSGPVLLLLHGIANSSRDVGTGRGPLSEHFTIDRPRPARPRRVGHAARGLLARRPRQRRPRSADRPRPRARHGRRPLARRRRRDAVRLPVPRALRAPRPRLQRRPRQARSTCCCAPPRSPAPTGSCRCSPRPGSGQPAAAWPRCSSSGRIAAQGRPRRARRGASRSLDSNGSRQAFLHTVRAVIDVSGQRVSANDRLHLAAVLPTLIVWGEKDSIIPVKHGEAAHEAMPDSRFVVFPGAGHMPHHDDPERFAATLDRLLRRDRARPGWRPTTGARCSAGKLLLQRLNRR